MAADQFEIKFTASGRGAAQCKPDPAYPDGVTVDAAGAAPSCRAELPYPAPECGWFEIRCRNCPMKIIATAAGRADDPRVILVPCRRKAASN